MLITNNYSTNIYKSNNISKPIKNTFAFRGVDKDSVEISTKNKAHKKLTPEEKTVTNLMALGFDKDDSNNLVNSIKNDNNFEDINEAYDYLTKDVPKFEDKNFRKYFIIKRIKAISETANSNAESVENAPLIINKEKFNFFNSTVSKYPSLHNQESLENLSNVTRFYDKQTLKQIDKYIDKDENAPLLVDSLMILDFTQAKKEHIGFKKLLNAGVSKDYMKFMLQTNSRDDENSYKTSAMLIMADRYCEELDNLKNFGIKPRFALSVMAATQNIGEMKELTELLEESTKHRTELGSPDMPADDIELIATFIPEGQADRTLNTIGRLGHDNLVKMYPLGIGIVSSVINNLGHEKLKEKYIQPLIEVINPTASLKYAFAQDEIEESKEGFSKITDKTDRQERIKRIADATSKKNTILNNSIKDPKVKADAINIYLAALENSAKNKEDYKNANELAPYLKYLNSDNKEFNEKLKNIAWGRFSITPTEKTKEKINFNSNVQKLILTTYNFDEPFSDLIDIINEEPDKTVKETLDELPQNQTLKKSLQNNGMSYAVWTGRNSDLDMHVKIEHSFDKMSKNAITNLNAEFNDELFQSLPDEQKQKLTKRLASGGYNLKKTENIVYEGDGYFAGTKQDLKLYKGDKPIEFKDLSKIYKLINTEFDTNDYWKFDQNHEMLETNKGTFKNHIETRHEEMKRIRQYHGSNSSDITIKKVDMDDIPHSLFLGNDSSCCTALGSFNDWTAPNYIKNKMVQAIELTDGKESIGNSMMYLISTPNEAGELKPALLVDNIELKPKYQYNDNLEDGIVKYCKNFCKELGKPDMEIYAGPNRHKLNMDNFEMVNKRFQMLGDTCGDEIYLDFLSQGMPVEYDSIEGSLLKLCDDK